MSTKGLFFLLAGLRWARRDEEEEVPTAGVDAAPTETQTTEHRRQTETSRIAQEGAERASLR